MKPTRREGDGGTATWAAAVTVTTAAVLFVISGAAVSTLGGIPGCNPLPVNLVVGILAVLAGCLAAAYSGYIGWHTRNGLHGITAAGATLFVIGVIGQRATVGTQNPEMATACAATATSGAWATTVQLPFSIAVDQVALAGVVLTIVGLCAVLLFERIDTGPTADVAATIFEDQDTV